MDFHILLASINSARQLGSALIAERDGIKAAAIQIDLSEKLIQAQSQISEVLAAIISKDAALSVLTERIRELEASQSERARYQLAKLGTVGEFFAYQLRPAGELSERTDEPAHFLCQPCFDAGKKGVLRVTPTYAFCPLCKLNMQVGAIPSSPPRQVSRGLGFTRDW